MKRKGADGVGNYDDAFIPVPAASSFRTILSLATPGYEEDPRYIYRLLKPLYGMPSAARAWHTTMSAFLQREGCETVMST